MKSPLVSKLTVALPLALCLACSGPEPQRSDPPTASAAGTTVAESVQPPPATAQSVATSMKAKIPEVAELIEITEDNDPNNLIGRPNGYVAASVLVDSRLPR